MLREKSLTLLFFLPHRAQEMLPKLNLEQLSGEVEKSRYFVKGYKTVDKEVVFPTLPPNDLQRRNPNTEDLPKDGDDISQVLLRILSKPSSYLLSLCPIIDLSD